MRFQEPAYQGFVLLLGLRHCSFLLIAGSHLSVGSTAHDATLRDQAHRLEAYTLSVGTALVEVCDEPAGTLGERHLGPDRRVRSVCRAALRLRGNSALYRRMGIHYDLLRHRPGDHPLAGPRRP